MKMVRNCQRKTSIRLTNENVMNKAEIKVRAGKSCRAVAKNYKICHIILMRYIKEYRAILPNEQANICFI